MLEFERTLERTREGGMTGSIYHIRALGALDAAEKVFARRGFGEATMREIADAAGISVAGLYYYLPGKQHALYLSCERAFRRLIRGLDRALTSSADPREQLRAFVRGHLEFVIGQPNAFRVLLRDMDALEGEDRVVIVELRRQYFSRAADLVIAVQQQAELSTASTRVATAALFGMMNWTPMWHHDVSDDDAASVADQMTELFLHGVTAPSPVEVFS
jgi:TetR/AcrR family transcriptional regulator, cholesterol catabolism regulator